MAETATTQKTLTDLLDILQEEHQALLAGQAGTAGALLKPKMEAMKAFDTLMENPANLRGIPGVQDLMQRIVSLSSENAALFSAVRNGLNAAVTRVGASASTAYVGAYTQSGEKTAFSKAVGGYAKKA